MKKPVLLLCLFLLLLSVLFASNSPVSSISLMIDSDFSGNYDSIFKESTYLSDHEKMSLYSMYENSPTVPFIVNFLVGAGIGSFIQGDKQGGFTALVADVVGIGIFSTGYTQALSSVYYGQTSSEGSGMILLGAGIMLASKIYQIIRPFSFSKEYNNRLRSSLQGNMKISLTPVITTVNNQYAVAMAGNISF